MGIRILVLGGDGMVGRRLAPLLQSAGADVVLAGRSKDATIRFDWMGEHVDDRLVDRVSALYLVPPALVADPVDRITRLLDVARRAGVKHVVAVSSLGVTFSTEPPDSSRLRYEQSVAASGLLWTILRPSGFMQNFSEGFMVPVIRQPARAVPHQSHPKAPASARQL